MIDLLASFFIKDIYCYTQLVVNQVYVSISLLLYSHLPTAIISLFAGSFLIAKNKRLETKIFFFLTLAFSLFTLGDLTEWFVFLGRGVVIFARSIIELADPALFILSSYFLFVLVKKRDIRFIYKIIWLLPIIIYGGILTFSLSQNLFAYNWDICEVTEGNLVTVYGFYMDLLYMISAVFFAIWSIIKSRDNRREVSIASVGVCLFIVLFFVMEYVFTGYIFGNAFDYSYFVYAFFGMPILILFLGYLIIKYNEFNIKLVAAQVLVWALIALIGAQFFFIDKPVNFILNVITFVAVIIFGMLLIRSVKKEIEQKEKIEKIEKEVEKAYAMEKEAHEMEKKVNEELRNLDKAKNQFLMQAQHDLRSPLATFKAYCEAMANGTFGKLPKKSLEAVKMMYDLAESKLKEVNTFLDISQFQLGKGVLALKPGIDISHILQEIITELKTQSDSKGIYLKIEMPEKINAITADENKLKAALLNIIDNAIKYTKNGGVNVNVINNDFVKISVSDTGIGMSKDDLKNLFEKIFERGEQAKKTFITGRGIGLYLASQIIKGHNGRIWAESDGEDKGSTFHIELPIK